MRYRRIGLTMAAGVAVVGVGVLLVGGHPPHPAAPPHSPVDHRRGVHRASHSPVHSHTPPTARTPTPAKTSGIPAVGQSTETTAQASLSAVTHQEGVAMPAGPIDVVANPANRAQTWAFATEAASSATLGKTLWFGERTGNGPWTWIPSTLPGALSPKLPPAVYSALQWAYDLHEGEPGPPLNGTVSWNAITGQVGEPVAWVAGESDGMLTLTVWVPSYVADGPAYYGVQSEWFASTAAQGQSGLSLLIPSDQSLSQLAQNPNP